MSPPAPGNPWDTGGELTSYAGDSGADTAWDTGLADESVPDLTSLMPPAGGVSWGPTEEDLKDFMHDSLLPLFLRANEIGWPLYALIYAMDCAKAMHREDFIEVMDTLYNLAWGEDQIDMTDPCQIRRMAKIGNCVARRYLGIDFGPDLQDFWLDGKAAEAGTLQQETFQFPPDDRGSASSIAYYPMNTGWFFGRVGDRVEQAVSDVQALSLWEGVRERLRAPEGTVFPVNSGFSGKNDVSPLLTQAVVGTGPSTFHSTGLDWIYPDEFAVVFKHPVQNPNELNREFADEELFLAGGMTVTSEVEVRVSPGTVEIDKTEFDGWTVTIDSWRLRVSDRIDYHGVGDGNKTQLIPLGPIELVLPDQLFVELKTQGCPGTPTPADFDVITDAWHELSAGVLSQRTLFVLAEPYQAEAENPFSGAAASFDFWDPASGHGIKLLDI